MAVTKALSVSAIDQHVGQSAQRSGVLEPARFELGKTAGKDAAAQKPTFVSLMGLEASESYAQQLLARALASIAQLEAGGLQNTAALRALADMLVNRRH